MSEDLPKRLSRWSERKLAARHGAPAEEHEVKREEAAPAAETQAPAEQATPALPSIDELTAESDYTVFLGKDVPVALKNAALRKLWVSNPFFNVRDGLDDYDEDFNELLTPVAPGETGYKIGKGYVDDVEKAVAKLEPANDAGETQKLDPPSSAAESKHSDRITSRKDDAPGDKPAPAPQRADTDDVKKASGGPMEEKDI